MTWKPKKAFDEAGFVAWLGQVEGRRGNTPYQGESRVVLRARCARRECGCSHLFPCEAGWIEITEEGPNEGKLVACAGCRPAVAVLQSSVADRRDFQAKIRDGEARDAAVSAQAWN